MLYFKLAELAEMYHVHQRTISNWIRDAKDGKLDLELHEQGEKSWIAKTTRNIALIEQLAEDRKKYRNTLSVKVVSPRSAFYDLFSATQILDISSSIDIHREIPFQYGYFDGGADYWDKYVQRLASEETPNFLNATVKLLNINMGYLDELLSRYKRVNVIDVGVGNGLPVKDLLQHLLQQDKLGRYIAVDISTSMLDIAEQNISTWFGGKVSYEGHEADINYDRFSKLIEDELVGEAAKDSINLVLVLGGTLVNLRAPSAALRIIHDSMNRHDLMVYTLKLDSEATRQYFDFGIDGKMPPLDAKSKLILDLMNIDESYYDVEMGYDNKKRERYMRIRFKVAITLKFTFAKGDRTIELNKNDTLLLWRYWHQGAQDAVDQLVRNEFDVIQTSQTEDKDYLLTVVRVRPGE